MQAPITPPSTASRDREVTDYLYTVLRVMPIDLAGIDAMTAALVNSKREAVQRLEDAELNAQLTAEVKGKNETERKLESKAALAKNAEYLAARREVMQYEGEIELNQAEATGKRRGFQAAIALAELHAARINMIAKLQRATEVK